MRVRREPTRTCVGCRERGGKATLIRVVRRPDGAVEVDAVGAAGGRGAYVHADPACIDRALATGALGRALRRGLSVDEAARLRTGIEREARQ